MSIKVLLQQQTASVLNVFDTPVYPADASASLQAAVDALPAYGGRIILSAGAYLVGNVQCGQKAVQFEGEGGPGQSALLGHGATELVVKDGTVGITFGTPNQNLFRGPVLSNLRFVAQSPAALGALLFHGISGSRLSNVTCSNFSGAGAYGRKYLGGSSGVGLTMYNEEVGCQANSCTIGVWGLRANGLVVMGGLFDANDNKANAIIPNTTGLLWEAPGDTLTVIGARFQSYARHIDNLCEGLVVQGTRHEAFTIGIRSLGNFCRIEPGEMTNSFCGGAGTGIAVSGNRNFVNAQAVNSVTTRVDHAGATSTMMLDNTVWVTV